MRSIRAIGNAIDALDPFHESRKIQEILERNGYEKTGGCSYLSILLSLDSYGPSRLDSYGPSLPLCGYNFFQKGGDVFIVGDMGTLTSHPLAGKEMSLTEKCIYEGCPHGERIRCLPIAHATLRSVSNKEMLAYLQTRFTSQ